MIKYIVHIFIVATTLLFSCTDEGNRNQDNLTHNQVIPQQAVEIDSSILYVKVQVVNQVDTIRIIQTDEYRNITFVNQDTLFNVENHVSEVKFIDFDQDGHTDILYCFYGNNASYELALYQKGTTTWKMVEGFNDFESVEKLRDKPLYYTYSGNGCADSDWSSYLIEIDAKLVVNKLGKIEGRGCKVSDANKGIFIYQLSNDSSHLKDSILRPPGYYDDKWRFIEDYWHKKSHTFANNFPCTCCDEDAQDTDCMECYTKKYGITLKGTPNGNYQMTLKNRVTKESIDITYEELTRFGFSGIKFCTENYVVISMSCGGPCTGDAVIFLDDYNVETYMYANYLPNNNLVLFRKNEQFDSIHIRNLLSKSETVIQIDTCVYDEDAWSGYCSTNELFIIDSFLIIDNRALDTTLSNQEINIKKLLE
ncbi:hypothetical protein QWY85_04475 [Neolewinella lacunae]|uniref:Uncharacterized protein n=1 Tax=Neolewinella lacunae TaxID=1517758 RepID=A0A923PKG9_9BACT|nr:hypothetical protein [Neolewinella lacunae]MBC6992959.1 hypothetical protein [Neolewinella lacunae]MDN3633902.1 hypothetical protein [Neolewinella lacunae]